MTIFTSVVASELSDIYSPVEPEKINKDIEVNSFTYGVGIHQMAYQNNQQNYGIETYLNYKLGDRWEIVGNLQFGDSNSETTVIDDIVIREADEQYLIIAGGGQYSLIQGSASINGRQHYPWQMAIQALTGHQTTGDTSGRYTAIGLVWLLEQNKYNIAVHGRYGLHGDQRLDLIGSDRSMQWGITLGGRF